MKKIKMLLFFIFVFTLVGCAKNIPQTALDAVDKVAKKDYINISSYTYEGDEIVDGLIASIIFMSKDEKELIYAYLYDSNENMLKGYTDTVEYMKENTIDGYEKTTVNKYDNWVIVGTDNFNKSFLK